MFGHPIYSYVYILYIFTKFQIFCSLINTFKPQKCSLVINMLKLAILELLVILVPKTDALLVLILRTFQGMSCEQT